MQSAGAAARQLDADYDDDPDNQQLTENNGMNELYALCMNDHHQYKDAQSNQEPLRPNIGTDLIEARQHSQRNNRLLTAAPTITVPAQHPPQQLHMAIRALHKLNDKDHTKLAYDPKRKEFVEFLDYRYHFQSNIAVRHLVEHDKAYDFMCYQAFRDNKLVDVEATLELAKNPDQNGKRKKGSKKTVRSKKKKKSTSEYSYFSPQEYEKVMTSLRAVGGDLTKAVDPPFGIGDQTLMQYKAAIMQMHKEQTSANISSIGWEFIWNLKCQEVFSYVKGRKRRIQKANFEEKIDYDTVHETAENILTVEKGFWTDGTIGNTQTIFSSLRNRFCFLMTVAAILRGESMFMAELSDLYGIEWLGDDAHDQNPFWVLMLQITTGKTHTHHIKLFGRAGRHKDPLQCPMGALGFYLMFRFAKTKEMDNIDFTDPTEWFYIKLLTDMKNKDTTKSIANRTYATAIETHLKKSQIFAKNKVHIGRKWGAFKSQLQGDHTEDTKILGNWSPSTQDKAYSVKVPVKIVRSMAGWRIADGLHYNARADKDPPNELVDAVFPWLQKSRDKVFASQETGNEHPTASKFLHLLHKIAVCVVQDAAAIIVQHPERATHGMFKQQLFQTETSQLMWR